MIFVPNPRTHYNKMALRARMENFSHYSHDRRRRHGCLFTFGDVAVYSCNVKIFTQSYPFVGGLTGYIIWQLIPLVFTAQDICFSFYSSRE